MSIFSNLTADIAWTVFDIPSRTLFAVGAAVLIVVLVTVIVLKAVKKKAPEKKEEES